MGLADIVKQVIIDNHLGNGSILLGDYEVHPMGFGVGRAVKGIEYAWLTALTDAAVLGGIDYVFRKQETEALIVAAIGFVVGYGLSRRSLRSDNPKIKKAKRS